MEIPALILQVSRPTKFDEDMQLFETYTHNKENNGVVQSIIGSILIFPVFNGVINYRMCHILL